VLIPVYIIWQRLGLLDTNPGLIIIYTLINLPIAVWMS
jgi:sorbitol/mannitol transport system permease protein